MRNLLAATLLLFCVENSANAVPTVFSIDPLQSNLSLTLEVPDFGITDSDTTTLSGTIDADLDFGGTGMLTDPAGLTFTGGQVVHDQDMSLALFVIFFLDATADITDAKGVFSTNTPPDSMTVQSTVGSVTTYEFDLADHAYTLNQGMLIATGTSVGGPIDEMIDFAVNPAGGSPDLGTIATIAFNDLGGDNYQAVMSMALSILTVIPLNDAPLDPMDPEFDPLDPDAGNGICDGSETCGEILFTLNLVATFTPGDFDGDTDVDGADFLKWQRGETAPPLDPVALAAWEAGYGVPPLSALAAAGIGAVPEPSSLVLLGLALGLIPLRTPRRRV